MNGILGLIYAVIVIVTIFGCLKSSLEGGKKILWILVILFLPVIGLILYYLLGKKK